MESIVSDITTILAALLGWFTTILGFIGDNPLMAITVFLPISMLVVTYVFSFFSSHIGKKHTKD